MKPRIATVMVAGLLFTTGTATSQIRKWTDNTGAFSIEAELAEVKATNVILRKPDGTAISVPISRLSTVDHQYLKSLDKATSQLPKGTPVWTMDPSEMRIPDSPLSGTINGQPFSAEKAELRRDILTFAEGDDVFPDRLVKIFLFQDVNEHLSGKTFRITPNDGHGGPHVHACWKVEGRGTATRMFHDGYALTLTFGESQAGQLPGRIYLCLPGESKIVVAGTFSVEVFDETHPGVTQTEISGKVMLRGSHDNLDILVGCMGLDPEGKLESPNIGCILDGKTRSVTSLDSGPRMSTFSWDQQAGHGTHLHVNRQPGKYLVSIYGRQRSAQDNMLRSEGYFDWRWVELKDDASKVEVDLTIDPENTGSVEVSVSDPTAARSVRYLPLDDDKGIPLPEADCHAHAASVTLDDGKAVVKWLRPGKYQFATVRRTGEDQSVITAKATVEVKRGARAEVDLNLP